MRALVLGISNQLTSYAVPVFQFKVTNIYMLYLTTYHLKKCTTKQNI